MQPIAKINKPAQLFGLKKLSQTWFIMKLSAILLFAVLSMSAARGYSQKINHDFKKSRIEAIFKYIEKESGYSFIYEKSMIKDAPPINLSLTNKNIAEVLNAIADIYPFEYTIRNNFVVISAPKLKTFPEEKLQQMEIKGVVRDSSGVTLSGVSVMNKQSKKGSSTTSNGTFTISASKGDILLFSFVGFIKQEVIVDSQNPLSIVLQSDNNILDQIVVTALGIKRSAKTLSYNVQDVKSEEIIRVPDASFVNSLSGKVAGVTINNSASGIGGSTRVVMRGEKSLNPNGNNNALYVLDGIPLPNLFSSSSVSSNGVYGGKDGGDGISDINPEDIESISVLTGASSAALYGGMAANGAVLVNTKSGNRDRIRINLSSTSSFYNAFVLPEFQNTYGTSAPGNFDSWGAKLGTPSNNNPKDFFQTGTNLLNSVSMSTGGDKSQTYFSVGANNANGIIFNNKYNRYNITLRHKADLNDKISLDATAMYIQAKNQNMLSQGQYLNPLVPIYLFPRGADMESLKVFERYNPDRNFKTQFWPESYGTQQMAMQNPFWTINRDFNTVAKERYILGMELNYKPIDWLSLKGRVRYDNTSSQNEVKNYASTIPLLAANSNNGSYLDLTVKNKYTYADLLGTIDKTFDQVGLLTTIGASILEQRMVRTGNSLGGNGAALSKVPNLFSSSNVIPEQLPGSQPDVIQTQSFFATAQLDYRKKIFLTLSGRNEWPSQLATLEKTPSLFYPSAGVSAVLSDMISLPKSVISYFKIRGSYSEVGNPPLLFMTMPPYDVTISGPNLNRNLPFDLKPERTKSYEAGFNSTFFNSRLQFDVTLYKANTYNQIFSFNAPGGSGFQNYFLNAGNVSNKGIEALLGYNGKIGNVKFNTTVVFTLNRNKIIELAENAINPFTGSKLATKDTMYMAGIGSASSAAVSGGVIGDIYVNRLATDPDGYILISGGTGSMVQADNTNLIYAGNPSPRYKMGFRNGISYNNFNLNFLVDWRIGGRVVSATQALMDGYGTSKASADARDNGGAIVNGYPIDAYGYYQVVGRGNGVLSQYVYSATNARLREASISYTLPNSLFKGVVRDLTLSVIGRNLFMFYNKAPFDPELTASTGTYFQGIDYFMPPSQRSFGFSIRAAF
ncbi:SusC/RagA family TonB-linked outer membrane protein [Sphingobacterium spiritivorum]|uniref:SusC/RagA family TonB-linked outer membrane protein n=1 Tax=Sphingobacterium spiritivorum TaxID=258 RepID=UPI003DA24872